MVKVGFELLEADKYYESLLKHVPRARKRIVIAAMALLWGERTAPIFIMLEDALKRGVQVTILLDNYTKLTPFLGLKPPSSGKDRLQQTFRTLEKLSAGGAKVHCFGKIGLIPHKGRCHVKVAVVDNVSYSFGGVNFYDEMFDRADYMLKSDSPELADCLDELVGRIIHNRPPLADGEVKLNRDTHILFDGGRPKTSLIYERACELASQAEKITLATGIMPSGELARLMNETSSTLYTNRPENMLTLEGINQAFDQQKYRLRNAYNRDGPVHCKAALFEMPDGRRSLLTGSHNFSYRGVSFGTQEIALHSKDPELWDQIRLFVNRRLA